MEAKKQRHVEKYGGEAPTQFDIGRLMGEALSVQAHSCTGLRPDRIGKLKPNEEYEHITCVSVLRLVDGLGQGSTCNVGVMRSWLWSWGVVTQTHLDWSKHSNSTDTGSRLTSALNIHAIKIVSRLCLTL